MKISVKVLADFMLSSAARKRSIVRDSKFPRLKDGKAKPQIVRYSEARAAIRDYHEAGNKIMVLVTSVEKLAKKKIEHPEKDASRIDDNIRAIKAYMDKFSKNEFKLLPLCRIKNPAVPYSQCNESVCSDIYGRVFFDIL